MLRCALLLLAAGLAARAEIHTMTLRQAVDTALQQSPDLAIARLDELKAIEAVRVAKDPFVPRIVVGSGLAYSNGFPMSIEGSAPSVVQAQASQFLFNRPQSYAIAQAKENARGAGITTSAKKDEVAFRTASLYLDAERAARIGATAQKEVESLETVSRTVQAEVSEGRELPIAAKRAAYNLARARQLAETLTADQETAESALAQVLGFPADDRVRPAAEERPAPSLPLSEEESVRSALDSSKELRQLESQIVAKGLEMRGQRASRLPRADLVAQYGLFAKYNNYDEYFRKFQRNNGQLGVSLQLPVLPGPGVGALTAQTQSDIARLRLQVNSTRHRIANDVRQAYRDLHKAQTASEVARLDLDVAREQLSINLALLNEGRLNVRQVEESRIAENDKWVAFYDAQYALERARWAVLRQTGDLLAALK